MLEDHLIQNNETILNALKKINSLPDRSNLTLFVVNSEQILLGTLTDGDLRRGFVNGININDEVEKVMNRNFRYLRHGEYSIEHIVKLKDDRIFLVPVLDDSNKVLRLVNLQSHKSFLPIDAVLMAGGRGERLKPLTDSVPKPLLKVGDTPIIEINIQHIASFGIENVHITLHYLGHQIEEYFGDGSKYNISIKYIHESKPLGTIGALALSEHYINNSILLMNADILTNIDFEDFYRKYINDAADMCVACVPYHLNIPYGVMETQGDDITAIKEKPNITFLSNAGIYLMNRSVLQYIPKGEFFNATDLIELLIRKGKKVTQYSLLGYWLDIGKPEDYKKAQQDIKYLKF